MIASLVIYTPATPLSKATTRRVPSRASSLSAALSSARSVCRAHVQGVVVSVVVDDAAVWVGVHDALSEDRIRVLVDTVSARTVAEHARRADDVRGSAVAPVRRAALEMLDAAVAAYDREPVVVAVAS